MAHLPKSSSRFASMTGADRCEPLVEDEAVIVAEVNAFFEAAGADLQALRAAVTRFVAHCRDRGDPVERIIGTLKGVIARAILGRSDDVRVTAINQHLLHWVLDAFYTGEA